MKKLTVAVFFGGHSPEYSVSLESAYSVITNLDREKYEVLPVGISQEGKWFFYGGNADKIKEDKWMADSACAPAVLSADRGSGELIVFRGNDVERKHIDVALPIMHGKYGEDGTIQGLIELAGIPLAGCGVLSSALCMDKDRAHKLAEFAGIDVAKSFTIGDKYDDSAIIEFGRKVGYPVFVKPVKAGSSYGVSKVDSEADILPAVEFAFKYDNEVIIEENIDGFEVGCAVMGVSDVIIGEVDEIELSGGFFDFTEKYTLKTSAIYVPARIDKETAERIKETARRLYKVLGCSGFARIDMFLTPEKRVVFNEVNTIPGFTEHSRFPGMMKAAGISFAEVLDNIVTQAIESAEVTKWLE
ncbi:MAG: D-alanine--D-serine ligase VanG [Firmicutes bacterium]|nr:D-alanine--D-serine ligase VanG [Bacillota bacterium]